MANRQQVNNLPLRTISDFKSKLKGGGARPNLFEVELAFPAGVGVQDENEVIENARFMVKAAAMPASTVSNIDVPFRGRILKIAGDRTFETWTITVLNDTSFNIRSAFEKWMNYMNKLDNGTGETDPALYQVDAKVHQLDRGGGTLRSYVFKDIFPTNITAIDLSYETTDTIQEFQVEMQVHYWEALRGTAAQAGGEDIN